VTDREDINDWSDVRVINPLECRMENCAYTADRRTVVVDVINL